MELSAFAARRAAFRKLHESGCFLMPNPWNAGTARYLQNLGFPALATTSAGLAFSLGLPDAEWAVPRDTVLAHISELVNATPLPVNADFESGYAHDPEGVAHNVRLCVDAGIAGLSIEDATGDPAHPLYDLPLAAERIRAARAAIDASHAPVLLTARAECFLVGHDNPLDESIRRLQAYAEAGADVLYAPGPRAAADIRAIVAAVHPKPVNLLMSAYTGLSVSDAAELGVRRISVGSALARAAWTAFLHAAASIAEHGSFQSLDGLVSLGELNTLFRKHAES